MQAPSVRKCEKEWAGLPLQEELLHRQAERRLPGQLQRDGVAGLVIDTLAVGRVRVRPGRIAVALQLALDEVDDPVVRDAGPGVDALLIPPRLRGPGPRL